MKKKTLIENGNLLCNHRSMPHYLVENGSGEGREGVLCYLIIHIYFFKASVFTFMDNMYGYKKRISTYLHTYMLTGNTESGVTSVNNKVTSGSWQMVGGGFELQAQISHIMRI